MAGQVGLNHGCLFILRMIRSKLPLIRPVLTYIEDDPEWGLERMYRYYSTTSTHIYTGKQEVDLIESPIWKKMLFLDGTLQSTTRDEVIYHNALVHPLMDCLSQKKNILILGGGEGATAREILRWESVSSVTMVDYDKGLVALMKEKGLAWSFSSLYSRKLHIIYDDAWEYMRKRTHYDGIIIDLTDPDLTREAWGPLLENAILSVRKAKGGLVMNAGLYVPWKTETLKQIKNMIESLCSIYTEFKYYMYTAFVPSFNGEWTFIVISHKTQFMIEPEFLECIPAWIRRSIRMLDSRLLDEPISTAPSLTILR